jgi:cell surface protein SprA
VPFFLVPNITISEAFAPLLRLNMDFTNQLTANVEYKKSRMLSLSLVDFQLAETRSEEFVVGIGWRKRGFPLPFKVRLPGQKDKSKQLENDINFRLDFSIRDDATSNSRLDQDAALPTAGQKVVTISPSIDYVLNNRINVKLFFDQRRTEPKISTSPPITFTRAGVQIRISLTQ